MRRYQKSNVGGVGVHFKRTGNNDTITFSIFSCLLGCYDFMQAIAQEVWEIWLGRVKPAKWLIEPISLDFLSAI